MNALFLSAASVGIIGGADGPTAIFVASRVRPVHIVLAALLLMGAAAAIVLLVRRRRRR